MVATTLFDMARMTTGTIGTGTITLGSAVQSFLTFAQAGVVDQQTVRYVIEDSPNREVGSGVYTASGTTLTRTVNFSTNSNTAISLSGSAQVALTALAEDIVNKTGDTLTGALNWATAPNVVSASTTTIGAASSNYIVITGTTAITAFDTIAQGALRKLRFIGSLTLTNSASLICIGGVNVTTQANDVADFISEGGGVWRMTAYQAAASAAVPASAISPSVSFYTASQTVTIPVAATKALVTLVGGGGGGAGCPAGSTTCCVTSASNGGAGGSAAVLQKYLSGLTPGNTFTLTIGAAGSAGSSGQNAGGNGGDTTLVSGTQTITTLTAGKGSGGGAAGSGLAGTLGTPGTATNGDVNIGGGTGGVNGSSRNAGLVALGYGLPAVQLTSSSNTGSAGSGFGAGGNGGLSLNPAGGAQAGGAGLAGFAVIEWYA